MIENQPVLTIHRGHLRPDPALVDAFRGAMTSHLVDAMEGRGAVDWRIKPMDAGNASFVGPALCSVNVLLATAVLFDLSVAVTRTV